MNTKPGSLLNLLPALMLALTNITSVAQTDLIWDAGTSNTGTRVYTHPNNAAGQYHFKVVTESSVQGGWRTALRVTAGNADLFIRQGAQASTTEYHRKSEVAGSDGFVMSPNEYGAGQEWFLMVDAAAGATWSLVSGEIFVQDLGVLPFTDTNANLVYDIGEAVSNGGPGGPLPMGAEGTRFFKASAPSGTPGWALWLNGGTRDIRVRKDIAPVNTYDIVQTGRLFLAAPYLDTGTVFIAVDGNPNESINLDSRIQTVQDIAFNSTQPGVALSGSPYRLYRTTVPPDLLGWDVSVTPTGGDANVAVRRDQAAGELWNDAFSEVGGSAVDSVTLVPPGLTDGTWFILVYGPGGATFTLNNNAPVPVAINFTDTKVNTQPARVGWRYFALTDIPSQLGKLGWQLELSGQVAGTEIALRRGSLPGRWSYRNGPGFPGSPSYLEYTSITGRLDRPGHQADVWYAGIYLGTEALGSFTLNAREIPAPVVAFDGSSTAIAAQPNTEWRWWRIDVPGNANLKGWELKLTGVTSGKPGVVVARGVLPASLSTNGWGPAGPCSWTNWPQAHTWTQYTDFTGYPGDPSGEPFTYRRLIMPMGRPLEAGTYYVGVGSAEGTNPMSYTLESRGIGTGFGIGVTTLAGAATASSTAVTALAARDSRYFKITVPANMKSWEVTLEPSEGEMVLLARKDNLPAPDFNYDVLNLAGKRMQKSGHERYVLLPQEGQDFLQAGDYYLVATSEGVGPTFSNVGTGTSSGTLFNRAVLAETDLGTATGAGVSTAVSLDAGQHKALRVLAPAGVVALEARLDSPTGTPGVSMISGTRLPSPFYQTTYGVDYGQFANGNASLVTVQNAPAGEFRVMVSASEAGPVTGTLVITARTAPVVAFNGGSSTVTGQEPRGWRFFRVDVPAGVLGWDVRLTGITGQPQMVVRRDLLPFIVSTTSGFDHANGTTWPTGYYTAYPFDYALRNFEPDFTLASYRNLTLAMGRSLEPGTYYIGVEATDDQTAGYTLESRGIGTGQQLPVTTLALTGGSALTPALAARRAAYYKVTVPASTPSLEVKLDPAAPEQEMILWVRRGSIPTPMQSDVNSGGGQPVDKPEGERFVVLPQQGEDFILPGDYYIAVASQGQSPATTSVTGTGDCQGTITSIGTLGVTNLGTATGTPTNAAVNLLSGQIKAWQITVPAGASSLDVVLETTSGTAFLSAVPGARLPRPYGTNYGSNYGQDYSETGPEFHVISPAAGTWSFMIAAGYDGNTATWAPVSGTLDISVAAGPEPLTFDGGSASVTGQTNGVWRFWEVTVPAGVPGWDLRVTNVTSGRPQIAVRRGQLPESLTNSGFPNAFDSWPVGASLAASYDLTGRYYDADGRYIYGQYLLAALGAPLEPGTYIVGVKNSPVVPDPMSYTLESRGVGAGQSFPVTTLAPNGTQPVASSPARFPRFFKTTIPANTPSWELMLDPTAGDFSLLVRKDALPYGIDTNSVFSGGGRRQQQSDHERFVLLPAQGESFLTPGDYYIAAASEGVNPGVPDSTYIGTGSSSGSITGSSPLAVPNLGTASLAGLTQGVSLVSGQLKSWQFTVPAGATALELRLDNRVGDPGMYLRQGSLLPETYYYASQGGSNVHYTSPEVISITQPAAGLWSLCVTTQMSGLAPSPASANLVVRLLTPQRLNFSSTENGNGFSHTDTRNLLKGQHAFYQVTVPASLGGQPIAGWWLQLDSTSSQIYMRVRELPDFTTDATISNNGEDLIFAPPYFQPGHTYYVEIDAYAGLSYTLTSQPVVLNLPAFTMPATPGITFADTGAGVAGDQGRDLAEDAWHFYAFDVPAGNGGLVRAELRALNGDPDLYLRAGGIPTRFHDADGPLLFGVESLVHFSFTGTNGTQYGNWTPENGQVSRELTPGRWYAAVRASSGSNARYRLLLSTGDVQTLALSGGSATAQNLAPGDVRYYKFAVPLDAPHTWNLTLSEQIGDVRWYVRDTIPPGDVQFVDNSISLLRHWGTDNKNQGPYPYFDPAGTQSLTTPPLRPGSTCYLAVQALNSAQFSVSSATAGGTIGLSPVIDFYTGVINTTLAIGERKRYRIPAPASALRWKHTATHDAGVRILIEQGTIPIESSQHYISSSANSSLDRSLVTFGWPWRPGYDYYLMLANDSGSVQNVLLTMDGREAATEDDDHDGMADPWETTWFGDHFSRNGSGDFDGDGLSDAVEYGLGLNPTQSSASAVPTTTVTGSGAAARLALDILLPAVIPPQVKLEVFGVDELGNSGVSVGMRPPGGPWNVAVTNIPGGVRVKDTQPYNTSARRFLWLTVTLVPEP